MGFWSNEFLAKQRQRWLNSLQKFQYQVSGVWYDAQVNSVQISGNSIIILANIPNVPAVANTVTRIRIYDDAGILAGEQEVSISRTGVQSILIKFNLPIQEV